MNLWRRGKGSKKMTTTTDLHPTLQEVFNNLPDPDGLAKIIVQSQRDERGVLVAKLFARGDNGCIIGAASQGGVQFGHTPCIEEKYFVSHKYACEYLYKLCRVYLGRGDVDFLVEEAEVPVQLATPGQAAPRRRM